MYDSSKPMQPLGRATLGTATVSESPMNETLTALIQVGNMLEDTLNSLDSRTSGIRLPMPSQNMTDVRPERNYSTVVQTIYEQVYRLEKMNHHLRVITNELEV